MKMEQLRPNIGTLPEEQAFNLFNDYYEKRNRDLEKTVVLLSKSLKTKKAKKLSKSKTKKKTDEVSVSNKQLEMLKKLGLI